MTETDLDAVFVALASQPRRQILDILAARPGSTVNQVAEQFEMSRVGVLKHINVLEDAGLLISEKVGRERPLYFNPVPLQLIHERWEQRLRPLLGRAADPAQARRRRKERLTPDIEATGHRLVAKITIRGSVEAVWRELTNNNEPQAAVFNAWLHAQSFLSGARLEMRTGDGRGNVLVVGNVVDFICRCFAHTFRFTQYDDPECTVIYELKVVPEGVEVCWW